MALNRYIKILLFFSIASFLWANQALANTYTSEIFSSLSSCESQKEKNNSLYPNFYRSNCVESSQGKFHYNICDTNYCVATVNKKKLVEAKDPGVYDYDNNIWSKYTTDYQLDEKTQQHIEKIANKLEKRFQKMSVSDLDKWNDNFINVIDKLSERSKNSKKNLALLQWVKKEVNSVVEKQKKENNLCKEQYGEGWKEAKIFDIEAKTVEWIQWNMKYTLACEYNEPKIVLPKEKDDEDEPLHYYDPKDDKIKIDTFEVEKTSVYVKKDWLSLNVSFTENVGSRNIFLRMFNDNEYKETNLKNYMKGKFDYSGWEFYPDGSPHFPNDNMVITPGVWYVLEIYDADNKKVLEQYELKLEGSSPKKIQKMSPIRNLFDGNKNRGSDKENDDTSNWDTSNTEEKTETYQKYLTPVSKQELYWFISNLQREMETHISWDQNFVYITDEYAISRKKYYWNQIYTEEWVCPAWYQLNSGQIWDQYTKEVIAYYLAKNRWLYTHLDQKYLKIDNKLVYDRYYGFTIKLRQYDRREQDYSTKTPLDRIKKESHKTYFDTNNFYFSNPWLALNAVDNYDNYHSWNSNMGSEKVATLLPVLCENRNYVESSDNLRKPLYDSIKTIKSDFYMKNSESSSGRDMFYTYWLKMVSDWKRPNERQYFLPVRASNWTQYIIFTKKID